jgi:hypothetical protein
VCTLPPPQKQHTASACKNEGINERMSSKVTLQESLLIQQVWLLQQQLVPLLLGTSASCRW